MIYVVCRQGVDMLSVKQSEISSEAFKMLDWCSSIVYTPTKCPQRPEDMEYTDPTGEAVADEYREAVMHYFRRAMREWAARKTIANETMLELSASFEKWEKRYERG